MKIINVVSFIGLSLAVTACQGADTTPAVATEAAVSATKQAPEVPRASTTRSAPAEKSDFTPQFIEQNDTLLARKDFDLLGDRSQQSVLIVRHSEPAASQVYPCELLVLKQSAGAYSVTARSDKVVDCFFNDIAKNATDLSDNLTLSTGHITYVNQGAKSSTTYTFSYASESGNWRLLNAESNYSIPSETSDDLNSYREFVEYPKDFSDIPLSQFDPKQIKSAMTKSKKLQK